MEESGDRAVTSGFSKMQFDLMEPCVVEWWGWKLDWSELKCSQGLRIKVRIWEVGKLLTITHSLLLA